jgi:hypothetical protein
VPIPVGERNTLKELRVIPLVSRTRPSIEIPIMLSDVPVLVEISISQNPIIIGKEDLCEVDEYIE